MIRSWCRIYASADASPSSVEERSLERPWQWQRPTRTSGDEAQRKISIEKRDCL